MEYRAVGKRIAVDLSSLNLPISDELALEILRDKGFQIIEVDLNSLARRYVGRSQYRRGALMKEAPEVVDCSSFTKWLYGQRGLWLPRRAVQQREFGWPINPSEIIFGDLVFAASNRVNFYLNDPNDTVGHVGLVTREGSIIHAAETKQGVVEASLSAFLTSPKFRGARRYLPPSRSIYTLVSPLNRDIELADDLRWLVLQSPPRS